MNNQEVEKLLKKISTQKMYGETDKAIANLHVLQNEFPNEKKYLALLASAYMDAGSDDDALEYCNKALVIDPNYPQAFELKGLLAEKADDKTLAEEFYRKSIASDPLFKDGYLRLLQLYFIENRFDEVIKEGEYLLTNFDKDRESYDPDDKRSISLKWLSMVYIRMISSYIQLKQYDRAIDLINESVNFRKGYIKDDFHFNEEDTQLFKLYFLTNDKQKVEEYKDKWLNFYKVSQQRVESMQKDAEQGYIEEINPENYI